MEKTRVKSDFSINFTPVALQNGTEGAFDVSISTPEGSLVVQGSPKLDPGSDGGTDKWTITVAPSPDGRGNALIVPIGSYQTVANAVEIIVVENNIGQASESKKYPPSDPASGK
jgi:hypothetical protein